MGFIAQADIDQYIPIKSDHPVHIISTTLTRIVCDHRKEKNIQTKNTFMRNLLSGFVCTTDCECCQCHSKKKTASIIVCSIWNIKKKTQFQFYDLFIGAKQTLRITLNKERHQTADSHCCNLIRARVLSYEQTLKRCLRRMVTEL